MYFLYANMSNGTLKTLYLMLIRLYMLLHCVVFLLNINYTYFIGYLKYILHYNCKLYIFIIFHILMFILSYRLNFIL